MPGQVYYNGKYKTFYKKIVSYKMWLKFLLIFITFAFVIILVIKRFAYFRPSYQFSQPRENFVDIYEGNLHAWYKQGKSGIVILFCHGNAGNLSHRQSKLVELCKMGHSVLIFDYSGFGQSKGVPNEQLCYANADMFYNYLLRNGYKNYQIVPYGESLGSAVASYIARKYNLPCLIIESGLPSIQRLIKNWNKYLGLLSFIFPEFDTEQFVSGYPGKILFLHCANDEVIPYSITDNIRGRAYKIIEMNGSHNEPQIPWNEIDEFIKMK